LSGADAGKKKLTLPRLASVTLPFTALTMASNAMRDDVIAVCGLKVRNFDCFLEFFVKMGEIVDFHVFGAFWNIKREIFDCLGV